MLAAIRSGKTRKKIRWTKRKLEEECNHWHIEEIQSGSAKFPQALEQVKAVYRSSWQYEDSKKIDPDRPEKFLAFIQSYSEKASAKTSRSSQENDSVKIRLLYCGDTAIAFDYILENACKFYLIFGSILPEYRNYGPGTILLADMLEHYRTGCIIELGGGYLDYKIPWASTYFNTMHVSVFGSSLKGRVIIAKHMMTKTLQYWDTPVQKIQRIECRIQNTLQRSLKLSKRISGSPDYILSLPLIPDQFIRAGNSEMDQQPKHTVDITEAWCKRLTELRRADDSDALTALFKRRLQEGAEGIALLEEDIPVAYTWTAVGMTLPEDGDKTRFSLDRSQVYIYDTFIDPDKRGQQLFPQLMYAVQQKYLKREKHQFIVLIDLMTHKPS